MSAFIDDVSQEKPLKAMQHFLECIQGGRAEITASTFSFELLFFLGHPASSDPLSFSQMEQRNYVNTDFPEEEEWSKRQRRQ
jgi:hypothetical protein